MADRYDGCGIFGGDCTILFFIILFLLLFYGRSGYGIFPGLYKE